MHLPYQDVVPSKQDGVCVVYLLLIMRTIKTQYCWLRPVLSVRSTFSLKLLVR